MMLKVFLWGTGQIALQVIHQYNIMKLYEVIGFIDNNASKWEKEFCGKIIYGPSILKQKKYDMLFILADRYKEIINQAKELIGDDIKVENYKYFYKNSIMKRYLNCTDSELLTALEYIKKNDLEIFNYEFTDSYNDLKIEAQYDSVCGMFFVLHKNKKLYFAKSLNSAEKVMEYYKNLLIEQDDASPHRYLTNQFDVCENDIVVDVGAAEGNFAIEIIERAARIYLIEADKEWVAALKETFRDYQEKVVIIPNYVTSMNEGEAVTLDTVIKEPVNFIKMDIEGNEWDALLGAEELISKSKTLKCAICSYHADFDETLIKDVLNHYGMECSVSQGYMWFPYIRRTSYVSTKLCRGIVQAVKNDSM